MIHLHFHLYLPLRGCLIDNKLSKQSYFLKKNIKNFQRNIKEYSNISRFDHLNPQMNCHLIHYSPQHLPF